MKPTYRNEYDQNTMSPEMDAWKQRQLAKLNKKDQDSASSQSEVAQAIPLINTTTNEKQKTN